MRLDRAHVTVASQIMLPTYFLMHLLVGLAFLLQRAERTSSPAFSVAKALMPIRWWGIVFMLIAVTELVALLYHNRSIYMTALTIATGVAAFWTVLLLAAAYASPEVSFTSAFWVGGWVAAKVATVRSLAYRERTT